MVCSPAFLSLSEEKLALSADVISLPERDVSLDMRVIVLAPIGRDAELICMTLAEGGIRAIPVASAAELAFTVNQGAGAALVAEEALDSISLSEFSESLAAQPPWSEFPLIILTRREHSRYSELWTGMREPLGHFTLLERPVRTLVLLSTVRAALRARSRQYEIRDRDRELFESESRYRSLVTATSNLVWRTDPEGRIAGSMPDWERFTGQSAGEYQGWGWADAIDPAQREITIQTFCKALDGKTPWSSEFRLRRGNSYRRVLGRAVPVRNEDGSVREWVATCTDVEQQRAAEEALIKQEKLAVTGRLAASIAHEINNPLQALASLVYLIGESSTLQDAREFATAAQAELLRVSEIVTQTLRFYRQSTHAEETNIVEVVESVLRLVQKKLKECRIALKRDFDPTGPFVCYAGELRQIIANIVTNAIDAMSGGGTLTIRVRTGRDWHDLTREGVRITIADSGPGIPAEIKSRIFEPFFTTKEATGTGLGLWVTSELLRKDKGSIHLYSRTTPGRSGTAFSVFLPCVPAQNSKSA
jgi:PAS domain S-box-containing protein